MITFNRIIQIHAYTKPVAMNYSFNGLYALVRDILKMDATSGHIFLFVNKTATTCKALYWDGTGFVILHKRLEQGRFAQFNIEKETIEMTAAEFALFFEGADLGRVRMSPQEFMLEKSKKVLALPGEIVLPKGHEFSAIASENESGSTNKV